MKTLILLSSACLLLAVTGCSTTPRGGTDDQYNTMQGNSSGSDMNRDVDPTVQPVAPSPESWPWPGREGGVRP